MPVYPSEDGFTIKGIAPSDLKDYPGLELQFWQFVVALGLKQKDRELAAGLNIKGKPLSPPISERTRKHRKSVMTPTGKGDPSAPPLMPGRALSRTRSLLSGAASESEARFFWRFDPHTGDSWAATLQTIADRWPGRDVIGLSPAAEKRVRVQAWNLWDRLKRGRSLPPLRLPVPAVGGGRLPTIRPSGGRTIAELEHYYRQPAAPIPGRPASSVLLRSIFGEPTEPGRAASKPLVPLAPRPVPMVRQRVALQPKPKPEAPKVEPALTLPRFATATLTAARATSRFRDTAKVWIIDAYMSFVRQGRYPMPLGEFKDRLAEAHRARLLTLARADLPGQLDPDERIKEALSQTILSGGPMGEYHFIRI